MMNRLLRVGSRGGAVADLQNRLNAALSLSPPLETDGIFGAKTAGAVRRFQSEHPPLAVDGIVGPNTFSAISALVIKVATELNKIHLIPYRPATSHQLCWASATGMLTGQDTTHVFNRTPQAMKEYDGSLTTYETFQQGYALGRAFALVHGIACLDTSSKWTADQLRTYILDSPVICDLLWRDSGPMAGKMGHWILLVGVSGSGDGMNLTIWDPMPAGQGRLLTANFRGWMDSNHGQIGRAFIRAMPIA